MDDRFKKTFTFSVKEIITDDESLTTIKGFASTFGNVDREGDVFSKSAFSKSLNSFRLSQKKIPLLFGHDLKEQIGGVDASLSVENDQGLFIEAKIATDIQRGAEVVSLLKKGFLSDFSIGFMPNRSAISKDSNGNRVFNEVELLEISVVAIPANPMATVTEVKNLCAQKFPEIFKTIDEQVETLDRMSKMFILNQLVNMEVDNVSKFL